MAVFLGSSGTIELNRTSNEQALVSTMEPADVNTSVNRFSFDFQQHEFMTGDLVEFTRINADGSNSTQVLDFVTAAGTPGGAQSPQAQWYVHVDASKGIALYSTWDEALAADPAGAAALAIPASTYPIRVELRNNLWHCLGDVIRYELNTNRRTADVTSLGEAFIDRISTLISGSGQLEVFWNYDAFTEACGFRSGEAEVAHYLHQLVLRQELGSSFSAKLHLKLPNATSQEGYGEGDYVYYEITGVVTDIGVSFSSTEPVRSLINFVTTGPIRLLSGRGPGSRILNTTAGSFVLQNGQGVLVQQSP